MTPFYSFVRVEVRQKLIDLLGDEFISDISVSIKDFHRAKVQTTLYGEHEEEAADIIVSGVGHELTSEYLEEVGRIL